MKKSLAEQRRHPRYVTRYPVRFWSPLIPTAEGEVINLSPGGCCIRSRFDLKPGMKLRLQIRSSADEPPIEIEQAVVHWQLPLFLGAEFLTVSQQDTLRLQRVIGQLEKQAVRVL